MSREEWIDRVVDELTAKDRARLSKILVLDEVERLRVGLRRYIFFVRPELGPPEVVGWGPGGGRRVNYVCPQCGRRLWFAEEQELVTCGKCGKEMVRSLADFMDGAVSGEGRWTRKERLAHRVATVEDKVAALEDASRSVDGDPESATLAEQVSRLWERLGALQKSHAGLVRDSGVWEDGCNPVRSLRKEVRELKNRMDAWFPPGPRWPGVARPPASCEEPANE